MATRLTTEQFETIIENYKRNGRDTSELTEFLHEVPSKIARDSRASRETGSSVSELMAQSVITEGRCQICGKEGKLYSETCEGCFRNWVNSLDE